MVSNKVVAAVSGLVVGVLMVSGSVLAQERAEVLERIKPVGEVTVAKPAAAAAESTMAPAPVAPAPMAAGVAAAGAEMEQAEAPAATDEAAAPAAAAPAEAAAPTMAAADSGAGAELYASKGCALCHGADGKSPIMSTYPKVAGLSDVYILNQLKDIKSGARSNGQSGVMKGILEAVSDEEMAAIAGWLSGQ